MPRRIETQLRTPAENSLQYRKTATVFIPWGGNTNRCDGLIMEKNKARRIRLERMETRRCYSTDNCREYRGVRPEKRTQKRTGIEYQAVR